MGQIIGVAAKPKRCNLNKLSQLGTPAAGEYILVSSDNSMNAAGQGNFDCYIEGNGKTAAVSLTLQKVDDLYKYMESELHKSTNLLDKDACIENKYINRENGAESTLSGCYATDFIPVSESGLFIQKMYFAGSVIGGAVYNSSKAWVRNLGRPSSSELAYTYEEGDAYIRYTIKDSTDLQTAMVNEGTTAKPYEAYYAPYYTYSVIKKEILPPNDPVGIDDTDFKDSEHGKNILDANEIEDGYYIDKDNGKKAALSGVSVTPFIPIPEGYGMTCFPRMAGGAIGGAIYGESYNYLAGFVDYYAPPTTGAKYVRFTINTENKSIARANASLYNAAIIPFTPYVKKTIIDKNVLGLIPLEATDFNTLQTGKNKFDKTAITPNIYISSSNAYETTGGNVICLSDFIPVSKNGLVINVSLNFGNGWSRVVDKDYKFLRLTRDSTYIYQDGDAFIQYSLPMDSLDSIQVEEGSSVTEYEQFASKKVISPDVLPPTKVNSEDIQSFLSELNINSGNINVFLPNNIYAVVGDTLQVFFKSLIQAVEPLRYNVLVACAKGVQYHRYWEYTPEAADIGTTTFKVTVKDDNGNILGSAQCNLVTVAAAVSPSSSIKVLCIGDSTTAGGQWVSELKRRLTGSGGTPVADGLSNISFVGSMENLNTKFEGHSGWAWSDYTTAGRGGAAFRFYLSAGTAAMGDIYSNNSHNYEVIEIQEIEGVNTILCSTSSASNTPLTSGTLTKVSGTGDASLTFTSTLQDSSNPFWDSVNNKMTFIPYANTYCGGSIDVLYVFLGANAQTPWRVDFSTMMAQVKTFADTLHSEFPNAKLKLMSIQPPSMINMMKGYGASGNGYADTYGMLVTFFRLRQQYQDFANQNGYEFVEFVDDAAEFDTDYNYPLTMKDVNARNSSVKEPYDNNTLHPSIEGYCQHADCVYRNFVAEFCQ